MDDVVSEKDPAEEDRVEANGEDDGAEDAEGDAEPDGEDVFNDEDAEGQHDEEEGDDVANGGGAEGEAVFLGVDKAAAWTLGMKAKPGAPLAAGAAVGAAQEEAALGDLGAGDVHGWEWKMEEKGRVYPQISQISTDYKQAGEEMGGARNGAMLRRKTRRW